MVPFGNSLLKTNLATLGSADFCATSAGMPMTLNERMSVPWKCSLAMYLEHHSTHVVDDCGAAASLQLIPEFGRVGVLEVHA